MDTMIILDNTNWYRDQLFQTGQTKNDCYTSSEIIILHILPIRLNGWKYKATYHYKTYKIHQHHKTLVLGTIKQMYLCIKPRRKKVCIWLKQVSSTSRKNIRFNIHYVEFENFLE
jgi:hypothetical protein